MTATFRFGTHTLDVALEHEQEPRSAALIDIVLHLAEHQRSDDAEATADFDSARAAIVYDRDPGHASLEVLVAPRWGAFPYTVVARLDGYEMHAHGVTGGETFLSWPTDLPPRAPVVAPTGTIKEITVGGAVGTESTTTTQGAQQ